MEEFIRQGPFKGSLFPLMKRLFSNAAFIRSNTVVIGNKFFLAYTLNYRVQREIERSNEQRFLFQGYKKYCDAHNNEFELRYFCTSTDCKKLICSECKDSKKHRSHDVYLASDVLNDTKVSVDGKINKGNNASKNLTEFLKVSEKVIQISAIYFSMKGN